MNHFDGCECMACTVMSNNASAKNQDPQELTAERVMTVLSERIDIMAADEEDKRDVCLSYVKQDANLTDARSCAEFAVRANIHDTKAFAYRWILRDLEAALGFNHDKKDFTS